MSDDFKNLGAESAGSNSGRPGSGPLTPGQASADAWLDARMRNVPLPVGLLRRLEQLADPEMARIERALVDVPLPDGMLDRLQAIAAAEPAPRGWRGPERRTWVRWALAASLLAAVGAVSWRSIGWRAGGSSVDQVAASGSSDGAPHDSPLVEPSDVSIPVPESLAADPARNERDSRRPDSRPADELNAPSSRIDKQAWASAAAEAERLDALVNSEANRAAGIAADGAEGRRSLELAPSPAPQLPPAPRRPTGARPTALAGGEARLAGGEARLAGGEARLAGGEASRDTLGSQGDFQDLPDLEAVAIEEAHGVTPPIVAQYDLRFLLRYGQHPFVSPGANPALRSLQLPLGGSKAAWRRLAHAVAEGRLPAPRDVRTEDFLAALDYEFAPPAPQAALAIATVAAPGPFGDGGVSLLQVGLHAGQLAADSRPATHLTLVVDGSRALRRSTQWGAIEHALGRLVDQMQPSDRLTVVAYSAEARTVVDSLSADELLREGSGRLASAIAAIEPRPAANVAAAVEMACWSASRTGGASSRKLLLVSGGRDDSGAQFAERVQSRLAEVARGGVAVRVVELGRGDRVGGSLDAWAEAAAGRVAKAEDAGSLSWRMIETLVGREPVVAEQASFKITFNPDTVESYRLLGHERASLTGPIDAQTEVDLRCGETATALFELTLKPGRKEKEEVATVEATWRRPGHGREEKIKHRVTRGQLTATFAAAPASLQKAAVAAYAAEALRGSYYSLPNRSLGRVADLAKQVAKQTADEPSFREVRRLIDQAERLRSRRANASSSSAVNAPAAGQSAQGPATPSGEKSP